MSYRPFVCQQLLAFFCVVAFAACGSNNSSSTPDAGAGTRADAALSGFDSATLPDSPTDLAAHADAAINGVDATGAAVNPLDATGAAIASEAGPARLDSSNPVDAPATGSDASEDTADAAFQPGPATPIVLNSGNTAQYNLADGTWKVFYFDAQAGQLYVVSELDGITRGYLGTSSSVSPTNYQLATDTTTGALVFTATSTQRYYLAVAVSGGGASGSFQVADGGQLLPLGTSTLSLTPADAGDAYDVFRFPITSGHGYTLDLQGPSQPDLGLAVAPRPERSSIGEFSYSNWGVGGSLPFSNETISATQVADSTSGFYFVNIRVSAAITFTIAITEN